MRFLFVLSRICRIWDLGAQKKIDATNIFFHYSTVINCSPHYLYYHYPWLPIGIEADPEIGDVITPIFITCDPQRDTVAEVNEYVKGNQ